MTDQATIDAVVSRLKVCKTHVSSKNTVAQGDLDWSISQLAPAAPPPPPPPPVTSPPKFMVPRSPGKPGDNIASNIPDFDAFDHVANRWNWAADPGGSSRVVMEGWLRANDHTHNEPADHRSENYTKARDIPIPSETWECIGFRWDPRNQQTGQHARPWWMFHQHHAPEDAKWTSPPQTYRVDSQRQVAVLGLKPTSSTETHDLGSFPPNRWGFFVQHTRFTADNSGFIHVWFALDRLPNLSKPATYDRTGVTTNNGGSANGRSHIGFYMDDSDLDELHGWWWGYNRDPDPAKVVHGFPA